MLLPAASLLIFVGTYTPKDGASRGIYAVRLDPATGAFGAPTVAAETPNPTFLAWHPGGRVLYALGEGPGPDGKTSPGAVAFAADAGTGALTRLAAAGAGGGGVTHLATDATAGLLALVSYTGGQVAAFKLAPDGTLGARTSFLAHQGALGPNPARQDKPHPHSVTFSPDNRFAYVCDLGLDRIRIYGVDPAAGTLTPAGEAAAAPGAGPRHSKLSPDGRFLYVINELDATLATYAREPATGALTLRQSVATLPEDFRGENLCAEVRLHPNGRFVYGSNRGHDSLVVFARDPESGTLTFVQRVPCGGRHPRNFALSPDGAWLVCANRDSNNVASFRVDPATGRLTPSGQAATVPQAVCVLFAP